MQTPEDIILENEKYALDKWCKGDTSGFKDICSDEITYFDPFQDKRLDGSEAFKNYMDSIKGTISIFGYELQNTRVQMQGDTGILTFNFVSYSEEGSITSRWNGTEVFKNMEGDWRIIHSHWSINNIKNK